MKVDKIVVDQVVLAQEMKERFVGADLPIIENGTIRNAGLYLAARSGNEGCIALSKEKDVFKEIYDPFFYFRDRSFVPMSFQTIQYSCLSEVTKWGLDIPEGYYIGEIKKDITLKVLDDHGSEKIASMKHYVNPLDSQRRNNLFGMFAFRHLAQSQYFKMLYLDGQRDAVRVVDAYVELISPENKLESDKSAGDLRLNIINNVGITLIENLGIKVPREYYVISESSLNHLHESEAWKEDGFRCLPIKNDLIKVSKKADLFDFSVKFKDSSSYRKMLDMKVDFGRFFNHNASIKKCLTQSIKIGQEEIIRELYKEKIKEFPFEDVYKIAASVEQQDVWDLVYSVFPNQVGRLKEKISSKAKTKAIELDFSL